MAENLVIESKHQLRPGPADLNLSVGSWRLGGIAYVYFWLERSYETPEGHPGQHAYIFVIRILSTSLTSVSIFSVCRYSRYLSPISVAESYDRKKAYPCKSFNPLWAGLFLPGRKYGQPCAAWPPPPQSTEQNRGINSSEGIDSAIELIFHRNRFLLYEKNNTLRKRVSGHMYQMKSLFQLLKLRFHGQWATLFHTRFLFGDSSVPSPMAASKIGPPDAFATVLWILFWSDQEFVAS